MSHFIRKKEMYKKTLVHRSLLCNVTLSCNPNNDQDSAINNNQTPPINNSLSQWECRTHNARLLWKSRGVDAMTTMATELNVIAKNMDLRYQKQIKLFKNQEIKISKSGLLPNYRTKKGSTTTKDFSITSEIP